MHQTPTRPHISPAFVAGASRCRRDGARGPKERVRAARRAADPGANAPEKRRAGAGPAGASGLVRATGSRGDLRAGFDLRRSCALVLWFVTALGGGVFAAWGSALPAAAAGLLSVLAAASLVRGLRLHALRSAGDAVIGITLDSGIRPGIRPDIRPDIRIEFRDGGGCGARLRAPPLVHAWLVVLRLETDRGRLSVLVPPDSLATRAEHKRMRVVLRLARVS